MVYRPSYQWYINPLPYTIIDLIRSTHDQVRIVMSRLKLKVNNCLLNKEFFKLFNKIGYNCFIIFQDYLNIKILKYDKILKSYEIFEF